MLSLTDQQLFIGGRGLEKLQDYLTANKIKTLLLVTGDKSYQTLPNLNELEKVFDTYESKHVSDVPQNPEFNILTRLISELKQQSFDVVVAIGGGSVIDTAKILFCFCTQPFSLKEYSSKSKKLAQPEGHFIAMPTTAGTGSESTQFATWFWDKKKYSLDQEFLLPNLAILDPDFTSQLPPFFTACTGMDALSQAIESYWNVKATSESRQLAQKAIELLYRNLGAAVLDPNQDNRMKMARGSNLAGQAIQITRTTAPHSISYPMTSHYGVPHGQAVAVTLPHFFEFNALEKACKPASGITEEEIDRTLSDLCGILKTPDASSAKRDLLTLMNDIGLETQLSGLGINESDIDTIVENGFTPSRIRNNPRTIDKIHLQKMLKGIL